MDGKLKIVVVALAASWLVTAPSFAQSSTDTKAGATTDTKAGASTDAKSGAMSAKTPMKMKKHRHTSMAPRASDLYLRAAGSPPPGKGQQ